MSGEGGEEWGGEARSGPPQAAKWFLEALRLAEGQISGNAYLLYLDLSIRSA
jgi:hypothetical protein